jgi:hypothetical protein
MRDVMLHRRGVLLGSGAALLGSVDVALGALDYELRDLIVHGDPRVATRFTLLVPKHTSEPVPLLVALHGKGETVSQKTGAYAWFDAYGLGSCYQRLCHPPVVATEKRAKFWDAARLTQVNDELGAKPFGGVAVACPYTPDVYRAMEREKLLDAYADWITGEVIPRARKEAPIVAGVGATGIDGVSLGGYVGLEVFLRKPQHFGAWGSVQGAFGAHRVLDYAAKLKATIDRHGARRLHLQTSASDTYREEIGALSKRLTTLQVAHEFIAPPGAHTQAFLRDSGTLEMLLWHDRALRSGT